MLENQAILKLPDWTKLQHITTLVYHHHLLSIKFHYTAKPCRLQT